MNPSADGGLCARVSAFLKIGRLDHGTEGHYVSLFLRGDLDYHTAQRLRCMCFFVVG